MGGDAGFFQLERDQKLLLCLCELPPAVVDEAEIGTELRRIESILDRLLVGSLGEVVLVESNVRPTDVVVEDGDVAVLQGQLFCNRTAAYHGLAPVFRQTGFM